MFVCDQSGAPLPNKSIGGATTKKQGAQERSAHVCNTANKQKRKLCFCASSHQCLHVKRPQAAKQNAHANRQARKADTTLDTLHVKKRGPFPRCHHSCLASLSALSPFLPCVPFPAFLTRLSSSTFASLVSTKHSCPVFRKRCKSLVFIIW